MLSSDDPFVLNPCFVNVLPFLSAASPDQVHRALSHHVDPQMHLWEPQPPTTSRSQAKVKPKRPRPKKPHTRNVALAQRSQCEHGLAKLFSPEGTRLCLQVAKHEGRINGGTAFTDTYFNHPGSKAQHLAAAPCRDSLQHSEWHYTQRAPP